MLKLYLPNEQNNQYGETLSSRYEFNIIFISEANVQTIIVVSATGSLWMRVVQEHVVTRRNLNIRLCDHSNSLYEENNLDSPKELHYYRCRCCSSICAESLVCCFIKQKIICLHVH